MRRSVIDAALREAFSREASAAPYRMPRREETERALATVSAREERESPVGNRRMFLFAASAVLAASALFLTARFGPEVRMTGRPLARLLSASLPRDAGERFEDVFLNAGASLRGSE